MEVGVARRGVGSPGCTAHYFWRRSTLPRSGLLEHRSGPDRWLAFARRGRSPRALGRPRPRGVESAVSMITTLVVVLLLAISGTVEAQPQASGCQDRRHLEWFDRDVGRCLGRVPRASA